MKKQLLLFLATFLPIIVSADDFGTIGIKNEVRWTYVEATQTLTISGKGQMNYYHGYNGAPWYPYRNKITTAIIEDGVTNVGFYAFYQCSNLNSITIPNSVESIGEAAFCGCSNLTSITIPNSVTGIENSAFLNCSGLTSITIPNSVTSIQWNVFEGCSGLTSITIPNNVTSIGGDLFPGCSGLTSIIVEPGNTKYDSRDNCNAIIETETNTLISGCNKTIIPYGVTKIDGFAFSGRSALTSITIPNSVTSIGDYAFANCSGLTSITIPNSVKSIGQKAFYGCYFSIDNFINNTSLSSTDNLYWWANIIDQETSDGLLIKGKTIVKCRFGATSVTIPNNVTTIGSSAFSGCSGLTSITIPNSVTSIGSSAFNGCSSLSTIHISDLVWWCNTFSSFSNSNLMDNAHHLYLGDQEITNLEIPDGITTISSGTFYNCAYLTSITIPNSVTNIGSDAFEGCDNLLTINSEITEPFNCRYVFSTNTLRKGTLYVPAGTKDLYTRFDGWREFLKIEEVGGEPEIYNLAFVVDNKELSAQNVEVGTAIAPPTKDGEGNTITWYTYPSTMPAHDLVVYGMVVKPTPEPAPTKYTLTYMLDGQQYKQLAIEEGATVAKETEPSKEGYSFSGWQNEPTTMPGRNVTVTGSFTIKSYRLSFIAENRELSAKNQQYGSAITAPTADGEGNTITWYTYPSTMPDHDLVVYGMVVKQPEPEVFVWLTLKDGQGTTTLKVKQGTEQALTITPEEGWKLLTVTMDGQDVTAQVKDGGTLTTPAIMQDATIAVVYEQEVPSEVAAARQSKADIKVVDDGVVISNAEANTRCTVYASNGQQVVSTVIDGGSRKITLPKGQVYVLTLGTRTLKFAL